MNSNRTRREFLIGGTAALAGAAVGVGGGYLMGKSSTPESTVTSKTVTQTITPTPQKTKIRMQYVSIVSNGPLLVAREKGFFEKQAFAVEWVEISSPSEALNAMLAGHLDTVNSGITGLYSLAATGKYLKILHPQAWIGSYGSQNYYSFGWPVVRADLAGSIQKVKDLRGRTITVPFGSGSFSDMVSKIILLRAGLTPEKDVNIVYASYPKTVEALASKTVDATLELEVSFTQDAVNRGFAKLLKDPDYLPRGNSYLDAVGLDRVLVSCSVCTEDFLTNNPGACERFRQAYAETIVWMRYNSDEAASIIAKATGLSLDASKAGLANTLFIDYPFGFYDWQPLMQPIMKIMLDGGFLKSSLDLKRLVQTPCFAPS